MPRILVQDTVYRTLLIGRDGHLDQSEAYDKNRLDHKTPGNRLGITFV